jgi:predicted O-methyltransferase YrrM
VRYRFTGDDQEEEAALGANPAARALLDPFLPVLLARAIITAVDAGVFEALGARASRATELAETLSVDPEVLEMLLRILVSAEYLSCAEGEYDLTDLSRIALLPDSPTGLTSWVKFNRVHWEIISLMEHSLRTGQGADSSRFLKTKEDWAVQQMAMLETARPVAPWVAGQMPIRTGATRLLDIGGSHGLYGASICRLNPPMKSTVLDVPGAVENARELAQRIGIDDIVEYEEGDALKDDLGIESLDAVFLGNVVHHFTPEQNEDLLGRIETALRPDGTAAIWDIRYAEQGSKPDLFSDGFALFFRISSSTRCYRDSELVRWLNEAGFIDIETYLAPAPTHLLVLGRKRHK